MAIVILGKKNNRKEAIQEFLSGILIDTAYVIF